MYPLPSPLVVQTNFENPVCVVHYSYDVWGGRRVVLGESSPIAGLSLQRDARFVDAIEHCGIVLCNMASNCVCGQQQCMRRSAYHDIEID